MWLTKTAELADQVSRIAMRVVKDYLATKPTEKLLVVADTGTSGTVIDSILSAGMALGAEATLALMLPRKKSGEEPPRTVAAAMKEADVIIAPVTSSIYHTQAKFDAQKAGARGVLNAPPEAETWTKGGMTADYFEIRKEAEKLAGLLTKSRNIRILSDAGTDLSAKIEGRKPVGWLTAICQNKGEVSALPAGEVSLPPIEGTANGKVVFEHAVTDIGALSDPIKFEVRNGLATNFRGAKEAEKLERIIKTVENADNLGEIGIGLNPLSLLIGDIDEAKKRRGTAHVALGDNAWGYGGNVECDVHLDGLILNVTVELDGERIIDHGKILF